LQQLPEGHLERIEEISRRKKEIPKFADIKITAGVPLKMTEGTVQKVRGHKTSVSGRIWVGMKRL